MTMKLQPDSLAKFYEFSLCCWGMSGADKRGRGTRLTLLASVHELCALLQELSWDFGDDPSEQSDIVEFFYAVARIGYLELVRHGESDDVRGKSWNGKYNDKLTLNLSA